LRGLIDEDQEGALRRERQEEVPWRIDQHPDSRERIARRIRDSTRGGKWDG
jgi:hypothetical protein